MKYLVLQKQEDEGCDYTIGCGMNYEFIAAENHEEAVEKTLYPDGRDEHCVLDDENRIAEILVLQVQDEIVIKLNVHKLRKEHLQWLSINEAKEVEAGEREQLKILQEKYEK